MEIPFIHDPAQEISMTSGRKGGREKRIGSQERLGCEFSLPFGSADQIKKRDSPIHHSEKEVGASAGIRKGVESVCKMNPEFLGMRGKLFEGPGLRA
jgi:hypothetical protein